LNLRALELGRFALERREQQAVGLLAKVSADDDRLATPASHDYMLRVDAPWLALAKATFGDLHGGQELIAETPLDCRTCVALRGCITSLAGDVTGSEKWFTQAIDMAVKLPQVYVDRGQARLDRGEVAGALADATQAAALSPQDGDAWKLWGDVLAKQGHAKEALAIYGEALKYAPHWVQLKDARQEAAMRTS
jgi:tetratricopeptide (TPR) repeat protein